LEESDLDALQAIQQKLGTKRADSAAATEYYFSFDFSSGEFTSGIVFITLEESPSHLRPEYQQPL
jgi:hypothetical protein